MKKQKTSVIEMLHNKCIELGIESEFNAENLWLRVEVEHLKNKGYSDETLIEMVGKDKVARVIYGERFYNFVDKEHHELSMLKYKKNYEEAKD